MMNGPRLRDPGAERAFVRSPQLKLYAALVYHGTATPYLAAQYTQDHLSIAPEVRAANITTSHFAAGHTMYIDSPSMDKPHASLTSFIDSAVGGGR